MEIDNYRVPDPWYFETLAEGLRFAASKYLDVEFDELVTGYPLRNNPEGTFVDIYLYDSLISGVGYAISAAEEIGALIQSLEELLCGCNCESACYNCLKHYRNQFIYGMLDQFAALQLLRWGKQGTIAEEFTVEEQKKFIEPLHNNAKKCLSPAKKYKVYKSSINKSIHFVQRSLSSSPREQRVTVQLNLCFVNRKSSKSEGKFPTFRSGNPHYPKETCREFSFFPYLVGKKAAFTAFCPIGVHLVPVPGKKV